ncbi:MAG: hypothetical protein K8F92_04690 [Hyphomicrobium sp.]|uniref:hypothetical protein n=1 Tax=Hyphomicrobium sp. TaxID=82 RepID=UPI0025B9206D|nr:hypothetical protein [Hyphomicrobium sp.]MBZ0208933.1 hypothetical protein [Hyphomicrobium sp.]
MKALLALLTLGLAAASTIPVMAHDGAAPMTKAECEKTPDMQWDAKTGTCVHK